MVGPAADEAEADAGFDQVDDGGDAAHLNHHHRRNAVADQHLIHQFADGGARFEGNQRLALEIVPAEALALAQRVVRRHQQDQFIAQPRLHHQPLLRRGGRQGQGDEAQVKFTAGHGLGDQT